MHHLVVRQGQDPSLAVQVEASEGELATVAPATVGSSGEVVEGVMHPAQVPFEVEAEPALRHRPADAEKGCGLLGDRDHSRRSLVTAQVELPQEGDRLQVVVAAQDVRLPVTGLARVVQVEHRGHRIDPESVDMELLQPVARVADQEVAHLGATEVEDEGSPVRMLASHPVGMLVERSPVEAGQRVLVAREVRGDPVEDDPDAGPMQHVDHRPQLSWSSKTSGRGVEAGDLVSPRPSERVLGDRQKLQMREAMALTVLGEQGSEILVRQLLTVGAASPRAEVNLVDAHRRALQVASGPICHPGRVRPCEVGGFQDVRRCPRRSIHRQSKRIGLVAGSTVGALNYVSVAHARHGSGHEPLPDPRARQRGHRPGRVMPVAEVARHAHAGCVWGPDGEGHAIGAVDLSRVCAEDLPGSRMRPVGQQAQVVIGHCATP